VMVIASNASIFLLDVSDPSGWFLSINVFGSDWSVVVGGINCCWSGGSDGRCVGSTE
jgi:hypothetical protein